MTTVQSPVLTREAAAAEAWKRLIAVLYSEYPPRPTGIVDKGERIEVQVQQVRDLAFWRIYHEADDAPLTTKTALDPAINRFVTSTSFDVEWHGFPIRFVYRAVTP